MTHFFGSIKYRSKQFANFLRICKVMGLTDIWWLYSSSSKLSYIVFFFLIGPQQVFAIMCTAYYDRVTLMKPFQHWAVAAPALPFSSVFTLFWLFEWPRPDDITAVHEHGSHYHYQCALTADRTAHSQWHQRLELRSISTKQCRTYLWGRVNII